MKSKVLTIIAVTIVIVFLVSLYGFCRWQNNALVVTNYKYANKKIPQSFNDYKILHISDFHNKQFGENQGIIMGKINAINPDIIVITGDLIDRRRYNLGVSMELIKQIVEIAPVYFVSGNHEAGLGKYEEIKTQLMDAGVIVLDNEINILSSGEESITIFGAEDPGFATEPKAKVTDTGEMKKFLSENKNQYPFTILLAHRPQFFDIYKEHQFDLVLSGHVHGGQFRIPGIGGIFAPNQGFFPKYDAGRYYSQGTTMFISRGLGNSLLPLRLFNRPELVVVTLVKE